MKSLYLILVIIFLQSCKEDDLKPPAQFLPNTSSSSNRSLFFSSDSTIYSSKEDGSNLRKIVDMGSRIGALDYCKTTNKILFSSNNGDFSKGSEIYTMTPDGSDLKKVTNNTFDEIYPVFSRDGRKIAFSVENINGFANIITINADGSNEILVTRFSDSIRGLAYEPAWSLNDSIIYFVGLTQKYGIHSVDLNGNNITLIWNSDSIEFSSPRISPNGAKLLCSGYKPTSQFVSDIYTLNKDGSNPINLTLFNRVFPYSFNSNNPSWSEDGMKISFTTNRDFASSFPSPYYNTSEIYTMDSDGSNLIRVTNDTIEQRFPVWK